MAVLDAFSMDGQHAAQEVWDGYCFSSKCDVFSSFLCIILCEGQNSFHGH